MTRPHIIGRIFHREMIETLRDWNMICIVIVLPFILTPLAFVALAETTAQRMEQKTRSGTSSEVDRKGNKLPSYKIALAGPGAAEFQTLAEEQPRLKIVPLPGFPAPDNATLKSYFPKKKAPPEGKAYFEEARRQIMAGTVDAVLVAGETRLEDTGLQNFWLVILSDETITRSEDAGSLLEKVTDGWRTKYRDKRLADRGETESTLRALTVQTEPLVPLGKKLAHLIAAVMPTLLFLMLTSGCYYAAVNAIPGEKERGTLATLLSAPVHPLEVLVGKWLNVMLIGFLGALANTASLLLASIVSVTSMSRRMSAAGDAGLKDPFEGAMTWAAIPWNEVGLLLLALVGLVMIFSALTLLLCLFARRVNDGNYLLTPLIIIICIPAAISGLPSTEWTLHTALTPILNNAVLIREIFRQTPLQPGLIAASFLTCAVSSFALLLFGARVFESERIRFPSSDGMKGIAHLRKAGAPGSTPSLVVILLLLPGAFYLGIITQSLNSTLQIVSVQIWMTAVVLGVILLFRIPIREALALRGVGWKVWPGIVLAGLSAWVITLPFQILFPMPESLMKALYETLRGTMAGPGGIFMGLLLVAVLPAVCEEMAFRGLIQTGLHRRFSPGVTFILTNLCFGLAHYSVFRFLPTAVLGILLSWVRWRTGSMFPGILIHGLNNGLAVLAVASMPEAATGQLPSWPAVAVAVVLLAVGLLWIARTTRPTPPAAKLSV